ncbi:hypothetical protein PCANC_08772 [Puccinia coronata f. sp. avenae]|uniref:WW domain-containing protein n=1 Tax=Puccinia coronata f. sp. avenae TaxID=200324 RepID=A0A2N5T1W8_9BASI|nr:hypothetical protein PCANC_08772 [Puccinia coronata f. sp. avenae]
MDPEDVLDFGEDDDGLDVISLGGSDHDGRPLSNRSCSTIQEPSSRSIRQPRASPPTHSRHHAKGNSHPNGSDRRRHGSLSRTIHPPQAPPRESIHQPISRPADRIALHPERRSLVEDASRHSERSSITASARSRPLIDRPRPRERASYMPPDRLQAVSDSSRHNNSLNPQPDSSRPVASLSTRITDRRDLDQNSLNPLSSSKPPTEREKFKETKLVKKPVEPSVDPASTELPEGWISRTSKSSKKTYYVNAFTRTSQWNRPTEPATGKPTKPTPKVASQSSAIQSAPQEILETPTHQAQNDLSKSHVVGSAIESPVISRSKKEAPDVQQAGKPAQPLDNRSSNLRLSDKTILHDANQLAAPQETIREQSTTKPPIDDHPRQSNFMGSRTAHASDSDIDGRAIHQEKPPPDIPEPYPRDHRIHPDRRKEIASASSHHRGRVSAPDPPIAVSAGSFHRDLPPHPNISNADLSRDVGPARYPHESDLIRPVGNHRPRSISPRPRPVTSHRSAKRERREPVQLSGANEIPKAPGRSFPDPNTPSHSHELFINPEVSRYRKPLSVPRQLVETPDFRDPDWRPRPDHPYDRDMSPHNRRPASWSRQEVAPISPIYPAHRNPIMPRPRSPSPPPRRMPASIPSVTRAPPQHDLYPPERARPPPVSSRVLEDRPINSPELSDSARRHASSRYDAYRPSASFNSETNGSRSHGSRRSDAYYPRDQGPQRSELSYENIRRSHVVQHSSILPEPPRVHHGMAEPDLYRPSPRPAPQRLSPRRTDPPPKYYPIIDLDEIPNKSEPPPRLPTVKNAHVPPPPAYPVVETPRPSLKEQSDRSHDYNRSQPTSGRLCSLPASNTGQVLIDDTSKKVTNDTGNPPPETCKASPGNANAHSIDGTSEVSVDEASRAVMDDPNDETSKATLKVSQCDDRSRNERRARSNELEDKKDAHASSDIIEIPPPQPGQADPEPPKQHVSLAKRLGPVADCLDESNDISPPAKRSKPNPIDRSEAPETSNDAADNSEACSPSPDEMSSSKNHSSSSPPDSSERIQTQLLPQPETKAESHPSAQPPQEKVISLRGRAGRKSDNTEVVEPQRSQVEERGVDQTMPTPIRNGSLRDRIQDLNFSPMSPVGSRPSPQRVGSGRGTPRSHDVYHGRMREDQGSPAGRHISERISGFHAPLGHSPSSIGHHRPRHAPRQSDSGWSGRKARQY